MTIGLTGNAAGARRLRGRRRWRARRCDGNIAGLRSKRARTLELAVHEEKARVVSASHPAVRFHGGRIRVDPHALVVLVDGRPAKLGGRAFDLLEALMQRRDRVVPKQELLDVVWPGLIVEENSLHVHVRCNSCKPQRSDVRK